MNNKNPRHDSVASVRNELTTIIRRGTARASQSRPALSLVDQSLLNYIEANPECRAVDIALHFQLNRSTVSRQLQALAQSGLIALGADSAAHGRGQAITLTTRGSEVQAEAAELVLRAMNERLMSWPDDEVARFAATLKKYNDGDDSSGEAHIAPGTP